MTTISPTEDDALTALRAFLLACLPSGTASFQGGIVAGILTVQNLSGTLNLGDAVLGENVAPNTFVSSIVGPGQYGVVPTQDVDPTAMSNGAEVVLAQVNRVPEPKSPDFVVMTLSSLERLATNVDSYEDCAFVGSIAGNTLTAQAPRIGAIVVGAPLFGAGLAPNTRVVTAGTGVGGAGTYVVAPAQTLAATALASGGKTMAQESRLEVQLDVHGPNSSNFAQIITTLVRDDFASDSFAAINPAVAPLYADDPKQMPFINAESQYESRWVVAVSLQVSQTVRMPQEYADTVTVGLQQADQIPA